MQNGLLYPGSHEVGKTITYLCYVISFSLFKLSTIRQARTEPLRLSAIGCESIMAGVAQQVRHHNFIVAVGGHRTVAYRAEKSITDKQGVVRWCSTDQMSRLHRRWNSPRQSRPSSC